MTPATLLREVEYAVRQAGRKGIAAREIAERLRVPRVTVNQLLLTLQAQGSVRAGSDWMFFPTPKRRAA